MATAVPMYNRPIPSNKRRDERMRQVVANNGKSLTARPKKWSQSLKGGGRLLDSNCKALTGKSLGVLDWRSFMAGVIGLGCISLRRRTTLNNPHIGNEAMDLTAMRLTNQRRWGGGGGGGGGWGVQKWERERGGEGEIEWRR